MNKFVKFKPYGINQSPVYVAVDEIASFSFIDYNGVVGTELKLNNNTSIRVGDWPEDVAKKLQETHLSTLNLGKDDVLVLNYPAQISPNEAARMKAEVQKFFPDNKFLVTVNGAYFTVIEPGEVL